MTIAAFVVSVVALAVSGVAARYAWRQARAAEETTAIERRRDLAERRPKFSGDIESVNEGVWYRLNLRLTGGEQLAQVKVTITEGEGMQFAGNQYGASGPEPRASAVAVEPLRLGGVATWRVLLDESYSSEVRLEVVCRGQAGEQWTVPVAVGTPHQPFVY